ncbi:MAG: BACON domain-containing protein [Bacteroidales bacterium]|nr:BACON domain-containing protein [Bacteroidales bacterium]MCL2133495.1 BACON domain-containing protein [Bacteroidales bacterium]
MKLLNNISWKSFGPALIVAAAMAFGLQSCEDKDNGTTDGDLPRLIINEGIAQMTTGDGAGTFTLKIDCNQLWKAESSASWCEVTPDIGKSSVLAVTKLDIKESMELDPRMATVVFTAGDLSTTFTVTQIGKAPILDIVPQSGTNYDEDKETLLTAAQTDISYTIVANQSWTATIIESAATWLSITSDLSSTVTSTTLTATALENFDFTDREASIVIIGTHSDNSIKVIQAAAIPFITVEPEGIPVQAAGGTHTVTVTANVDWGSTYTVEPASAASWIAAVGTPGTTTTFDVAANTDTESRSATVTFAATNPSFAGVKGTCVISQNGAAAAPFNITSVNDSSARVEIIGTGLDYVIGVNFDGVPLPAGNIKKQTATELWILAPATITAGTEVDLTLSYVGGTGPVETDKPNGKFTVTDFYVMQDRIYANANGANSILSTTLLSTFSVCDANGGLINKTEIDILLVSTSSDSRLIFTHPAHSTGTTNNVRCTSDAATSVGEWNIVDKNWTAWGSSNIIAEQFDAMTNLTTTFNNANLTGNTVDVDSGGYAAGEAAHENKVFRFKTRQAGTVLGTIPNPNIETAETRYGYIKTVKATFIGTPGTSSIRDSYLDIVVKVQRLAAD